MRWRGRAGRARPHAVLARSSSTGTASVASAAMSYSSGGANLRHGRVPFEAIKRFREKVAAGDPPLGPGVTLTDPRITDALVRMIHQSVPSGCFTASLPAGSLRGLCHAGIWHGQGGLHLVRPRT